MKLTKGEAVRLHVEMWTAMKEALGDCPNVKDRKNFKEKWCKEHFPGEKVCNNCFLCEYSTNMRMLMDYDDCAKCCPIDWEKAGMEDCCDYYGPDHDIYYSAAPISEILALPERETIE